jgi:glycosyltransferase involved in cell wall biosynthesis
VTVAAARTDKADEIRCHGLDFIDLPISRSGMSPFREAWVALSLLRICRRIQPDVVHFVTIKPIVYGVVVARLAKKAAVVNAITGLGFSFGKGLQARIRRTILLPFLRVALHNSNSKTIFQNPVDLEQFVKSGLVPRDNTVLIRGSGVDPVQFKPREGMVRDNMVVLASRMLWDKGVEQFVDAARIMQSHGCQARCVLVGDADPENLGSISRSQLEMWAAEGTVEWWGHRDDMPEILSQASVVVLPTVYPEGVPKVLLEAAACGCPIVATDVPGCREIVRHEVNGLLVPPRDSIALAKAIQTLLRSPELREQFGKAGREIAVAEFSEQNVVEQTLRVYRELLGSRWPGDTVEKVRS